MKGVYKFEWDCGRMGNLYGLFIADSNDVTLAVGNNIYFGEVLGKHSEIDGQLESDEIILKTDDPVIVKQFEDTLGVDFQIGFNPILTYKEQNEDEDEDE